MDDEETGVVAFTYDFELACTLVLALNPIWFL